MIDHYIERLTVERCCKRPGRADRDGHYLDRFDKRYGWAVRISEDWIRGLRQHEAFTIDRILSGTNLFRLRVRGTDPVAVQERLAARGVMLPAPQGDCRLAGGRDERMKGSRPDRMPVYGAG
jgi:hypothetical protein